MLKSLRRMYRTGFLSGVIPPPGQDSIDISRDVLPNEQDAHLTPGSDATQKQRIMLGDEMVKVWKYFDSVATSEDLPSIDVSNFFFHLPTVNSPICNMP